MVEGQKVLITGGAGFIGSHLVKAYLDRGYRVVVIDNLSTGKAENVDGRAKLFELDINDERVAEVFREFSPDIVNHHAAQASVRRSVDDPVFDAETNIIGSLRLLEAARRYGAKKFILASTGGAIYGEQDYFPADEKHEKRPVSPYGAAKASVEIYLGYYFIEYGLAYAALRYANVYGPRQDPHGEAGVVAIFSGLMLEGGQPIINGDGRQTRDFVYVKDVVAANLAVTESDFIGTANIGTGIETTVCDLFDLIKKETGAECGQIFGPEKQGEQKRSVLKAGLAKAGFGWEPKTPLAVGLAETVDFFRTGEA